MKQYVGISRDHSASMRALSTQAMKDYNDTVASIKEAAYKQDIDTIVSVAVCGSHGYSAGTVNGVKLDVINSNITKLKTLDNYDASYGSTPLFDSVGRLIETLETVPDSKRDDVSFLVMVITDGEENSSKSYTAATISKKIRDLQATDHWTFVFRVPYGYKQNLIKLGIPAGNIQEWEQTEESLHRGTVQTMSAVNNYYTARSMGATMSTSFYADASGITPGTLRKKMEDVSDDVEVYKVRNGGEMIRPFVEAKLKRPMQLGSAFYQLTKPEKAVQSHKRFLLRSKSTGEVFAGQNARDLLGLPSGGTINLAPGDHGNFDIFVQSTSVNRKLVAGTDVLYWERQ